MKHILSCISVFSDFASPEHLPRSFHLTNRMRSMSSEKLAFEDKLQVKNLIYHSVKNSLVAMERLKASERDVEPDGTA